LFKLYQEMIKLKKSHEAFNEPEKTTFNLSGGVKSIILEHPDMDVVIHGNFGLGTAGNVPLSFPSTGTWYNYFTGEELTITSTTVNFNLRASEFLLFTSEPLPKPEDGILQEDFVTSIPDEIIPEGQFNIYPNPTTGKLTVELPEGMNAANYRIIDMSGRVFVSGQSQDIRQKLEFDLGNIQNGIYIFEAFDTRRVLHQRFIKK